MRRRVLVFSHEFPPMQGGEGTYAYELSAGLAELGYEVSVLAGTTLTDDVSADPVDAVLRTAGIEIDRFDWVKRDRLWFMNWRHRFRAYLDGRAPFDHIFFANFTSCVVGHHFRPESLPSYSITLHGGDIDYFFTWRKWRSLILVRRWKGKRFFRAAKRLICVSDFCREKLLACVPFDVDPKVVHHGIEPPDTGAIRQDALSLRARLLAERQVAPGTTVLVYVARLVHGKGQDRLIRCLAENGDLAEQTHTIFVGGGSRLAELKTAAAEHGLEERVTFTGHVPRAEVMKYICFSHIAVSLSELGETFGIVLLEAMGMGKPVLALRHGAMVEVVVDGSTGFLASREEVPDRLRKLLADDGLRRRMGDAGRRLVETKFSNRVMAERSIVGLLDIEPCPP
jgi:glycosyltransferase involved in cell wall biosynthesis